MREEMCIFFQAEDGIRDSVASRGLGDVYKKQGLALCVATVLIGAFYLNVTP